jgi:hypothetical protein
MIVSPRSTIALALAASAPFAFAMQDVDVRSAPARAVPATAPPASHLPPAPAVSAPGRVTPLFTNVAASPTSDVPGIPGAKFTPGSGTGNFDRPWLSPNGLHWAIAADTDLATTTDEVILLDGALAVQEGTPTVFDPTQTWGTIDTRIGINDLGELAVTNNINPATIDDVTVKIAGAVQTVVTIEGGPIPALPGATWDDGADSPVLLNDGRISVSDDLIDGAGVVTTADDEIIVLDSVLIAREGITIPGGQTGTPQAWENFSLEDTWFSADGTHHLILGDLLGATTTDQVLVYDGNVVLQEGVIIPGSGFASPIAATGITQNFMDWAGNWMAYGDNADGTDWVVRNGTVLRADNDPIGTSGEQVRMTAVIDEAQETPPSGSAATGTGTFLVDTSSNTLWFNITLTGVVGETMAHIHGFAPPGTPAGILYALPVGNSKVGSITYLESEEQGILSGQTYVNIHTGAFPAGEIRGQILPAVEHWFSTGATFFSATSNQIGDFVIMGLTDGPSQVNGVVVLNNQHVIAREGDPVDLDGNGMFDDDLFLNTFGNDDVLITDAGTVYFTATMRNGAGTVVAQGFFRRDGGNLQSAFCFGDGSGTACPCGNNAPAGSMAGCMNSMMVGGRLDSSGVASVGNDSLLLSGTNLVGPALYFQGTTRVAGGMGAVFGDGLACAGGTQIRLGIKTSLGSSAYPAPGDASISVKGGVTAGDTRTYQAIYRDAVAFCTGDTFNQTNGIRVTWGP